MKEATALETRQLGEVQPSGAPPRASFLGGLCAALVLLALAAHPRNAYADTLEVGADHYLTITAAVRAAAPGDTILVHGGTYREQVAIDKDITLDVFGDGDVWVDGQCLSNHGFWIWGEGATLRNIKVKNTIEAAVLLNADRPDQELPSNISIDGMTLQDFDCTWTSQEPGSWGQYRAGIAAWYTGPGIRITNNLIQHRTSGDPRGAADGIWFKSSDDRPSGGGHYIAGNTIIGGWDGIAGEEEGSAHGTFDRDTTVENNTVRDCWDDGIQSEGGDQNVVIRGNEISGCGTGVAFAAPVTGPLYVENNYIHSLMTGLYGNHFCFKVGNTGGGTTYLTGNTCEVTAAPGKEANGIQQTNEGLSPIVSRRNVFRVSHYVFTVGWEDMPPGTDFDEDCLWTSDSEVFVKWANVYYENLASLQAATGQERNGRQTEDCSFLSTLGPLTIPSPPPQTGPAAPSPPSGPAGQDAAGQATQGPDDSSSGQPAASAGQTADSDDGLGALTSPVALALEGIVVGAALLALGFIGGVRWSRRRSAEP